MAAASILNTALKDDALLGQGLVYVNVLGCLQAERWGNELFYFNAAAKGSDYIHEGSGRYGPRGPSAGKRT